MMREITERENVTATAHAESALLTSRGVHARDTAEYYGTSADGLAARLRVVLPTPGPLRDQVAQLIRADERHGVERYRAAGRLDRRAITRTGRGAQNVFSRRTATEGVDTAVFLLLDGSGSMTTNIDPYDNRTPERIDVAAALALHLAEAAEAARGRVAVAVFYGTTTRPVLRYAKRFGGRFHADGLAACRPAGGTPLAAAMLGAAAALRDEPADRRILLALTDGADERGPSSVIAAVKVIEARGIETVGIGCGVDVAYAFKNAVNVKNLRTLADRGLAALVALLDPQADA